MFYNHWKVSSSVSIDSMESRKVTRRKSIRKRIRRIINGTAECPRLSVFRSNKQIYAQLIDDVEGKTIAAASSRDKSFETGGKNKVDGEEPASRLRSGMGRYVECRLHTGSIRFHYHLVFESSRRVEIHRVSDPAAVRTIA